MIKALPLDTAEGSAPDPHYTLYARANALAMGVCWDRVPQIFRARTAAV